MSLWYPCVYCTEDLHCTKYAEPGYESWCVLGPCTAETPSNGDMIRRMTDEELAKEWSNCPVKRQGNCISFGGTERIECDECILDWLKSPVEEKDK